MRPSDDTGFSQSDNITAQTTELSLFWSPASGATRYYYAWDNPSPDSGYTTSTGASLDAPRGHGWHWFYVRGWNSDGFGEATSLKIFIDRRVPIVSRLDLRDSDDTGFSNKDNITNDTDVRFLWSADPNGGSGIYQSRWGWNPNDITHATTSTFADVSPPLNNGPQTFYVVVEAVSGQTSEPVALSVWFDKTPPKSAQPLSPTGEITTLSPTITWNYSSGRDWKSEVELQSRLNASSSFTTVAGWPKTVVRAGSIVATNLTANREYRVRVREYDLAGNVGGWSSWTSFKTVTQSGPRVTSLNQPPGSENGPVDYLTVRFDKWIDPTTFTTADVAILRGETSVSATSVEQLKNTLFRIHFPRQTGPGRYEVRIGPDIRSKTLQLPMNQDGVAPNGQIPADRFEGSFTIGSPFVSGPRITSMGRQGKIIKSCPRSQHG